MLVDPGVRLQAMLDGLNAANKPNYIVPWFIAVYRHGCTRSRQSGLEHRPVSTALSLKEMRLELPDDPHVLLYREGSCPRCKQTARSVTGRIVRGDERPPLEGRVARGD